MKLAANLTRFAAATGKVSCKTRLDSTGAAGDFTTAPSAYNGSVFCLREEGKADVAAAGETFSIRQTKAC